MTSEYSDDFFQALREGALRSAEEIVPIVLDLIQPNSVIDVGCGTGSWLATFARYGVGDYLGIDGFVSGDLLEIPRDRFIQADLTQPVVLDRRFDLAMSLEVAEHLPDSAAKSFVQSLTRLAPAVLFSAAIPGQGGTAHLNEQWPDYWFRLFADEGFEPIDVLRPLIWDNERVELWYAQNTILYVVPGQRADFPGLQAAEAVSGAPPLAAVHPRLLAERDCRLNELAQLHAQSTAHTGALQAALDAETVKVRRLSDQIDAAQCETERHRVEAAAQREQAETLRRQAWWYRNDAQRLEEELVLRRRELQALRTEVDQYRFMAEPRNMSLRRYLGAMPEVVGGGLRRVVDRLRSRQR